jgi:hypothetical protein
MFNFSDGALLMFMGGLMALARNAPATIWRWLYSRAVITVEVQNNDVIFDWLTAWLAEQPYSRRARNLTATARQSADGQKIRSSRAYRDRERVPSCRRWRAISASICTCSL